MTTNERLLAEARAFWISRPREVFEASGKTTPYVEMLRDFALSQLRALKESGHLRCKDDCDSRVMVSLWRCANCGQDYKGPSTPIKCFCGWNNWFCVGEVPWKPCSCGGAERWGDL